MAYTEDYKFNSILNNKKKHKSNMENVIDYLKDDTFETETKVKEYINNKVIKKIEDIETHVSNLKAAKSAIDDLYWEEKTLSSLQSKLAKAEDQEERNSIGASIRACERRISSYNTTIENCNRNVSNLRY